MTQLSVMENPGSFAASQGTPRDRMISDLARVLRAIRPLASGVSGLTTDGREVRVEHARGAVVEWIVLRAIICMASEMDPELVLERNARLAFATIVLANGFYWLRVALPVDSAELANPRDVIALVADGAASLAPRPVLASSIAFDHYAI